ncbi:hypothetical protein ACP4OV_000695 [Aristida adscensionis]
MESAIVSTFMAITSCESQADAVQHLASCKWDLDRAINVYYSAGLDAGRPSTSAAAAPLPAVAEGDEAAVRAPIPTKVEALYDGRNGGSVRDAPSMWARPSTSSVPAVPIKAISASEIIADGWGDAEAAAEPGDGGGKGREEDPMVSCSMDAQDGEQGDNGGAEEEHCGMDVDAEDGAIGGDKVEEDETRGGDKVEENANASDRDEEDDGSSYNGSFLDDNYEDDDEYDFNAGMEEEEEEGPPRPEKKSLADLYRKPWDLMYRGDFHGAKVHAARKDQFLLVNLQKRADFASQLQNRDLWSHEVVKQAVGDNVVFLLLEKMDGYHGDECSKVRTFYKLEDDQLPAVLVVDPVTGQMRAKMCGAIEPDTFMLFIDEHTRSKPSELPHLKIVHRTTTAMPETPASAGAGAGGEQEPAEPDSSAPAGADAAAVEQEPAAPENSAPAGACEAQEHEPVPMEEVPGVEVVDSDEPMEGEQMYKLRLRFPGGSVVAKEFGCKRRVAALFAFCRSVVHGGGETEKKAFRILRFAGRAMEEIQEGGATFEDLGLNCATVSVVLDS